MGSISGEDSVDWNAQDSNAQEEKIFVAVRLRPMNERELEKNDVSDWDCINNTTIIFKNTFQERSMFPTAYAFDRVFGSDSPTYQVYEDAAKKIALSVLSGINSTIFAYGQTSSGKTYTMSGVTEYAVQDIYDYIDNHSEREFVLKFSALEIYNELVKDLLSTEGTPLRLLDDPERGTVVDKLTEVTLRDSSHLKELLSTCESQRQIGETTLNEMSSRSHQILRLTVESEAREYLGALNSSTLTASVSFVDLAGSERASQALSAGTRLKEGCHINRSLLTLGTVIRKLSKGRNAHIPYRDSKLTRILQNSLGGNAKTAIICTMSPAHSHLEQSRNTLLFANCAKQVSTSAQVNVVMSEKALVKQLQKELARLENELRNLSSLASSTDSTSALKEKELLIEKMDKEIRELTNQRNLAQSRVENMLRSGSESQAARSWVEAHGHEKGSWTEEYAASEASEIIDPLRYDAVSRLSRKYESFNSGRMADSFLENNEEQFLSDDTSPSSYIDKYFGPDPCKGWEKIGQENNTNTEDNCKEVQCIEIDFSKINKISGTISPQDGNQTSGQSSSSSDEDVSDPSDGVPRSRSSEAILTTTESPNYKGVKENKDDVWDEAEYLRKAFALDVPNSARSGFRNKKEQSIKTFDEDSLTKKPNDSAKELNEVTKPMKQIEDNLLNECMKRLEPAADNKRAKDSQSSASIRKEGMNAKEQNIKTLGEDSMGELDEVIKTKSAAQFEDDLVHKHMNRLESSADAKDSENSVNIEFKNEKEPIFKTSDDDLTAMHEACIREYNEVIKLASMSRKENDMDIEDARTSDNEEKVEDDVLNKAQDTKQSSSDWQADFERQKKEIIELWDACNTPLVHRSYFFLLFKGDPSDAVYMEVELRRLSYLKNALHGVRVIKDNEAFTQATSKKALGRERAMLSKRMLKKFSGKDREALYQKWGIDLKTKKRRLQLCRRIWTDTTNMDHVKDSATIVAKLVGFKEPGQAPKEMVGLSLTPKPENLRTFSWRL